MQMFTRAFRCEVALAIPGFDACQGEGRQLTCRTSGKECRDAPNVDCTYCDVHQQSLPLMTVQIQTTVNALQRKTILVCSFHRFITKTSDACWHRRINQQLECYGFKMWWKRYLSIDWKFANHVALLDDYCWVERILHWKTGVANSNTKSLQMASLGRLAWDGAKQRSVVPILHGLDFFCPTMMFLFTFSYVVCTYNVFCVSVPVP